MKEKIMKLNKKLLIVIGVVLSASLLLSCMFNEDDKEQVVLQLTYSFIKTMHYEHIIFDDDFSVKIYDKYMDNLDYSKRFLLSSDIKKFEKYKLKLDDEIKQSDLSFFDLTYQTIVKRQTETRTIVEDLLSKPFDLTVDEDINLDVDKINYAENKKAVIDYWRKSLKLEVLQEIDTKLEQQKKKIADSDTAVVEKTVEELEAEARATIKKNYDDYFDRLSKLRKEDYFSLYINAIALSCDPHTSYFAPKSKEDFDIQMSGELEGIGATLSQKFGEVKVSSIVVGGAAWKEGELEEGDVILKVAQEGETDPVSISNMRLDDAVRLIRGKKGTNVYLTIRKIDGSIKVIKIVRDKIILEETYIRSVILTDSLGKRIAYINMPSFYIDFQHQNGRKCSDDFKKELVKLKKDKVDGIIIDLRNNGGGSLQEVVKIAGFFIKKGPIVQVKDRNGRIQQLEDTDASILYGGDVVVMTNQFSASASEIFAAALQDYNRALIFGTPKTLGKGSVQQMLDMDRAPRIPADLKPLGAFKLTIQKFYRINGGSTQLKGVSSDIPFIGIYSYLDMGEDSFDNAMPWDKIPALRYTKWIPKYNLDSLKKWSEDRMKSDSAFIATIEYAKYLKEQDTDKIYHLTLAAYNLDKTTRKAHRKQFNKFTKKDIMLNINYLSDDVAEMQVDTLMEYRYDAWSKKLKKDYQLKEAFNIVSDMNKF